MYNKLSTIIELFVTNYIKSIKKETYFRKAQLPTCLVNNKKTAYSLE